MIKKPMSKFGEFMIGTVGATAAILLFKWFVVSGPLKEFIVKFAG